MRDRLNRISRLLSSQKSRASYIMAKLGVLVPAQIRAVRLKSTNPPLPRQKDLAIAADEYQSRISMFETPGAANITLETLANIAAGLKVGVVVKLVPFSEMLRWENSFSPSSFDVEPRLEQDESFINQSEGVQVDSDASFQNGNVAWSQGEPDVNSVGTERKPMETVDDQAMATAAGKGGR